MTRRRDRRTAVRETDALAPVLDAAEARWQAVGQPATGDLRQNITSVEDDIERDALARRRQQIASVLDHRVPRASSVEPEALRPDHLGLGHEGLGL